MSEPAITWIMEKSAVDLATGDVQVAWPHYDARSGTLRPIREGELRVLTLAFIAGYRAGNPTATDADVSKAVLRWAQC